MSKHLTLASLLAASLVVGSLLGWAIAPDRRVTSSTRPQGDTPAQTATKAALSYLDALRWNVLVDPDRRRRAIASRATAPATRQLDTALAKPAEALRSVTRTPPVVARPVVLGYRLERSTDDRATVAVWGLALLATGVLPGTTQWSTSRVDLVRRGSRWLVDSVRNTGGPSPSSSVQELAAAMRRFPEPDHAP